MAYSAWSVIANEQPTTAKWNILGTNDASFNDGTGIGSAVLTAAKMALAFTNGSNAGTAGGDTNVINLGSLKIMWGTTASQNISAGGQASLTVTFPVAFSSTTGLATLISGAEFAGVSGQIVFRNAALSTTSLTIAYYNSNASVGGTGVKAVWLAIGN